MDPIIAIALIAISVIIGMFLGRILLSGQDAVIEGDEPRPKVREELSDTRKELADEKEQRRRVEDELKSIRNDLKNAKQRAHDKGQQLDSANEDLDKLKRRARSLSSVESAREDMMAAQEEVARLRAELDNAGSSRGSASSYQEVAPVAAVVETPAKDDDNSVSIDVHRQKLAEVKREGRQESNSLRNQFNEQVSEERNSYKSEIRDLQRRLRTAVTDVDREHRRAENSDKAYLILKSQLESALDRLSMHDTNLRRPDQLTKADLAPARPKKVSAQPSSEVVVAAGGPSDDDQAPVAESANDGASIDPTTAPAVATPVETAPPDEAPVDETPEVEAPVEPAKAEALAEADKKNVSVPPATAVIPDAAPTESADS